MPSGESLFISGSTERIFLNLELGCSSSCSYCYLPSEELQISQRPLTTESLSPESLVAKLEADGRFVPGRSGTILSIGCFSECWDSQTRPQTIQLIQSLLKFDNWIQFATKRHISFSDLQKITSTEGWRQQVVAYMSTATITHWSEMERGTSPPMRRFKSFDACASLAVRAFLYIKPVLPGITLQDADRYGAIMQGFGVDAVVGDIFTSAGGTEASPISRKLHVAEHPDVTALRQALSRFGRVFANSTQHLHSH